MGDLFSLNTGTPQQDLMELNPSGDRHVISDTTASNRAFKANFGTANLSPGYDVLKAGILNGGEDLLRQNLAQLKASQDYQDNIDRTRDLASLKGGPITNDEIASFQNLIQPTQYDPSFFFEKSYADQMVGRLAYLDNGGSNTFRDAYKEAPDQTLGVMQVHSDHITNREYARTQLENYKETLTSSGFNNAPPEIDSPFQDYPGASPSTLYKTGALIPMKGTLEWNVIAKKYFDNIPLGLKGSVHDEVVKQMFALPPEQFKDKFDTIFNDLKNYDPLVAQEFAEGLVSRSITDKSFDNLMSGIDIGSVAGPALIKGANILKGVSKASAQVPVKTANVMAESGKVVEAGVTQAANLIRDVEKEGSNLAQLEDILPSLAKPEGIMENIGTQKKTAMERIVEVAKNDRSMLRDVLERMGNVERLTPEALDAGVKLAYERLTSLYPKISDGFYDTIINPLKDPFANTYQVEFKIGYPGGMPFTGPNNGEDAAKAAAEWMQFKPGEFSIKQDGGGSYIAITKPVRETDKAVRAGLIETAANQQPSNWLSRSMFGMLNRADYNFSQFNKDARLLSTYAPSEMRKVIYDMGEPIRNLSRGERKQMSSLWEYNSQETDPITGLRGNFYNTPYEIEDAFRRLNLGTPSERQISAYFAYTRMYDVDLYLRNLAITSAKSRLGVERVRFNIKGRDEDTGRFMRQRTDYVDGRIEQTWPDTPDDSTVLFITRQDSKGTGKLFNLNDIREDKAGDMGRRIQTGLNEGKYKIVQLHSPKGAPLSDTLGENQYVQFVVTDAAETAPLTYNHLPRRPGGHIVNEFPVYFKQPNWSKSSINDKYRLNYLGDKTIVGMDNAGMAAKFLPRFQEANRLMREGNEEALKAYVNSNLPVPYEQFRGWYEPRFEGGKEIPPFLDPKEDIYIVHNGKTTLDADNSLRARDGFYNAAESPYDLSKNVSVNFSGERSDVLYAIKENSSLVKDFGDGIKRALGQDISEPAWDWQPSKVVDPIPVLGRALGEAINSRWLNDYQNMAVESWVAQHGNMLNVDPDRLRTNPFFYFHRADSLWQKGLTGEAADQLNLARTSRQQIRQFLGYRGEWGRSFDATMQRLADGIYNKLGPRAAELSMDLLPYVKNSDQYLRTIAFKSTLGFWNLPQFFVQMNTFAHTAAVAGTSNAFPAVPAAYFSSVLRYTRDADVIAGMDAKLVNMTKMLPSKYRWKPGEFTESHNVLGTTGFQNVGGEVQQLDRMVDPTIYQSTLGKVIDSGDIFFKEGERSARLAAWHSAYREWKKANPGKEIDTAARSEILQRADDLNVNMSRASNSALNSGLLSTTTQFYSYAHSMASQIWGNKLTKAEKFRTLAVQSALYGVPLGLSTTGLPVYEAIRSAAINRGYGETINTDPLVSAMMNGFIQAGINWATGTNPNIGGKFGNSGMSPLRDALGGDKQWWEILLGVSGSTAGNIIASMDPTFKWAMNMFKEDNEQFPWNWRDVVEPFKNISTFNIAYRGYQAMNTGMWLSKKDIPITKEDPWAAAAMSVFGVQPQAVADVYLMNKSVKDQKAAWTEEKQHILKELRQAAQSYYNNDPDTGNDYMRKAQARFIRGGFPWDQVPQILSEALSDGYMTMYDKVSMKFPKSGATEDQRKARNENLIKQLDRQYPKNDQPYR